MVRRLKGPFEAPPETVTIGEPLYQYAHLTYDLSIFEPSPEKVAALELKKMSADQREEKRRADKFARLLAERRERQMAIESGDVI
jgi:hypothetical protein